MLYACPPPAATAAAPARALDSDAAHLLHQLAKIHRQVDVLWRSAQQRLGQAQDTATEVSTPTDGVRTPHGGDPLLGADSQLPTLLNVPLTPQSSSSNSHPFVADGMAATAGLPDGVPAAQSSSEAGMHPSDASLKSSPRADESTEQGAASIEQRAHPRGGTIRRLTAFAASPSDTSGLHRRSLAARTAGLGRQGPGLMSRRTVAGVLHGGVRQGHSGAEARGLEQAASVLEAAAATLGMPDTPVPPSRGNPGHQSPSDKALRRRRFQLKSTAPGLPVQPQNLLILTSSAGSEPRLPAADSQSFSGELATEESTQSAGALSSETDAGAAGSTADVGEMEARQQGPDTAETWYKPPRLRAVALQNKRAVLLGQCLLQEVACVGQAVSAALSSVATLRACCAQGARLPADVQIQLNSLWQDTIPACWVGRGRSRGTPLCSLEHMPWLRSRAVAGWLERVRVRVQCLQALVDSDWRTAPWAAAYADIEWPGALVAASERLFAATNQYVLAQVGSLAFVGASPEQLALGEAHFVLPPSGVWPPSIVFAIWGIIPMCPWHWPVRL